MNRAIEIDKIEDILRDFVSVLMHPSFLENKENSHPHPHMYMHTCDLNKVNYTVQY